MAIGVVGLGYWGPNLVRNLYAVDPSGMVVCDKDEARLKRLLDQYPSATGTTDLNEVLRDESITGLILATPIVTHFDLGMRALEAGKSILVEKPLAASAAEARTLVERARELGLLAMAGHTFLYSPPVRTVHELLLQGELGTPLYVQSSRVNLGVHQADVSVLWDLAPHDLSILFLWLGEYPTRVLALGRSTHPGRRADVAFVDLEFPSGCIASLHLSWLAPTKIRRITLVGSKKMVVYEDTNPEEPVKVYDKGVEMRDPEDFGEHQLTYRSGSIMSPHIDAVEPLRAELEDFVRRVEAGEAPDEREEAAVRVVQTIEAAERSMDSGGSAVTI